MAQDQPSQQEHQLRLLSAEDLIISPALKYVALKVSYALALTSREDLAAYEALSDIFRAWLTSSECQGVAYAALKACDPEAARGIFEDLFEPDMHAGPPDLFDCTDPVEDADAWAGTASQIEVRVYGMACMARIPEAERPVMLAALKGRAAT